MFWTQVYSRNSTPKRSRFGNPFARTERYSNTSSVVSSSPLVDKSLEFETKIPDLFKFNLLEPYKRSNLNSDFLKSTTCYLSQPILYFINGKETELYLFDPNSICVRKWVKFLDSSSLKSWVVKSIHTVSVKL